MNFKNWHDGGDLPEQLSCDRVWIQHEGVQESSKSRGGRREAKFLQPGTHHHNNQNTKYIHEWHNSTGIVFVIKDFPSRLLGLVMKEMSADDEVSFLKVSSAHDNKTLKRPRLYLDKIYVKPLIPRSPKINLEMILEIWPAFNAD